MAYGILYDFLMGQSIEAYRYFGAHFLDKEIDGKKVSGVVFRLYAPLANDVSVIGEWNNWDVTQNKMEKIDSENVKISVDRSGVPAIVENLVNGGVKVYGVYSEEVSLEDAFLKKTGGNVIE